MAASERQFRMLADMCAEYDDRYGDEYTWRDYQSEPFEKPYILDDVLETLGQDPLALYSHFSEEMEEYMDDPIDGSQIPMLEDILGMFRGFLHAEGIGGRAR